MSLYFKIPSLLLLSIPCLASADVGLSYLRIDQNLAFVAGNIEFPMNAVALDYTKWSSNYSNFGFKLLVAAGSDTENAIKLDKAYTAKIDYLISGTVLYKYQLTDRFTMLAGIGYTSYSTTWTVDGIEPWWANDIDNDWSYQLSVRYEVSGKYAVEVGYTDYYRKNKVGFGKETTRGFNVSLIYKF